MPDGLTPDEERILKKVIRRAHYLDKGFTICGVRFGWTFIIGIVPGAGDAVDAYLNYTLVVKKAKEIDGIPDSLIKQMMFNNAVSIGIGLVPVVGDFALAAWKTNWRNANLLEKCAFSSCRHLTADLEQRAVQRRGGMAPGPAQPTATSSGVKTRT